jgi:hypothetical protein
MASRIWLAAAFVVAFGASPAHAEAGAPAMRQRASLGDGPAAVLLWRAKVEPTGHPKALAEPGERIA